MSDLTTFLDETRDATWIVVGFLGYLITVWMTWGGALRRLKVPRVVAGLAWTISAITSGRGLLLLLDALV